MELIEVIKNATANGKKTLASKRPKKIVVFLKIKEEGKNNEN